MKYIIVVMVFVVLVHQLSFAKYNWTNGNKVGAVGAATIGLAAMVLSLIVLFIGNYEV